jgi:hypothetical protein
MRRVRADPDAHFRRFDSKLIAVIPARKGFGWQFEFHGLSFSWSETGYIGLQNEPGPEADFKEVSVLPLEK